MKPFAAIVRRRGFALVLVLIVVALAVAMTVLFLSGVGSERRGVDTYARGSQARQLADTAVNLVLGQINTATKEGTGSSPISWASQPGMIRTYKPDGTLSNAYKLYSWDSLVESTGFNPSTPAELPPANWNSSPAFYTDLNQPINGVYPIVDGTIANYSTGGVASQTSPVNWDFPGEFAIAKDNTAYSPSSVDNIPMPVKWLYVLQDGSCVAPAGSGTTLATVPGASGTNPIVGRIAFWTDDETSKVNINTASEGTFWDTPKAGTRDEMQFAANPPVEGEFQAVLGHPATTSLSAVFPEMRQETFLRWTSDGNAPATNYFGQLTDIYNMTPRINWGLGGSHGGTYPVASYNQSYAPPLSSFVNPSTYGPIIAGTNRLYASADELWFQPQTSGSTRPANTVFGDASVNAQELSQRLFFLTANSRAPETTLFETPRVSLWPVTWPYANSSFYINAWPKVRTPQPATLTPSQANLGSNTFMAPQERLLAFCSTLNVNGSNSLQTYPYYFQRQNPDSPTWDWSNIQRNQDMVNYLWREIDRSAPGMGSSLASKWGINNAEWITLNCFDYSRSLINQYTYNPYPSASPTSDYLYTYTGLNINDGNLDGSLGAHSEPNAYSVTPLHVPFNGNTYTTEGAYPTLKEAAVVFYATQRQEPVPPTSPTDLTNPNKWTNLINWNGSTGQSQTTQMQAVMLFNFAQMNPGVFSYRGNSAFMPVFWIKVTCPNGPFQVNGASINLPLSNGGNSAQYSTDTQRFNGEIMQPAWGVLFNNSLNVPKTFSNSVGTGGAVNWSLTSDPITVKPTDYAFSFTGTKIQVDIYAPAADGNLNEDPTTDPTRLVSSQQIDFSSWTSNGSGIGPGLQVPIPLAPRWNVRQAAMSVGSTLANTSGVFMPSTGSNSVTFPNWQVEIVPQIQQLTQTTSLSSDPRTPAGFSQAPGQNPGSAPNSVEPLMYAYKNSGGTLISTSFANRLVALGGAVNGTVTAFGNSAETMSPGGTAGGSGPLFGGGQGVTATQGYQVITPYDTVISMVSDPRGSAAGDARLMGRGMNTSSGDPGSTSFVRVDKAVSAMTPAPTLPLVFDFAHSPNTTLLRTTARAQWHQLGSPGAIPALTGYRLVPSFVSGNNSYPMATRGNATQSGGLLLGRDSTDAAVGLESNATMSINANWDWTTQPGNFSDGGYLLRPDQEYQVLNNTGGNNGLNVPYFEQSGLVSSVTGAALSSNVFLPNRQVPSPVILGMLPSSMTTGWQTLTFCPNPAAAMNGGTHPGPGVQKAPSATGAPYLSGSVPDHLLLDLFWMPVAEPYPISEQFSTAGKVNLNYAMMPFPYIQRKTALDAVLKSVWLTALPSPSSSGTGFVQYYKSYGCLNSYKLDTTYTRYPINVDATLKAFDYKFQQGDIFRSASQICDMFLYPNDHNNPNTPLVQGNTTGDNSAITAWWNGQQLTAANARQSPYNAIYSRITTKSNSYTVHWRVQALAKAPGSTPTTWNETQDRVLSELRGSNLAERYIDPNASTIPDYAADTSGTATPLSQFYKWRVVSENDFQP